MNDLISVIVPVYEVEKWLDECIESITNQTYKNLEIILVDDGSKDRCPEMCDEWEKKDKRIRVIHKENGGLSSARNAGLEICKGNYISFVDSDDFLEKNAYEILIEDIQTKNVDVVRFEHVRYRDGVVIKNKNIGIEKIYDREDLLECYFYYKEDICGAVWDKLYRAELFDDIRFPEGINSEDYYVNLQVYLNIKKMYYNNKPLYYYRLRDGSITRESSLNKHSFDKIKISDMVYKYVKKNVPYYSEDAIMFQALSRFAVYYETMKKEHTIEEENEWIKDLGSYILYVRKNRKVSKIFKLKYFLFCKYSKKYMFIKKFIDKTF